MKKVKTATFNGRKYLVDTEPCSGLCDNPKDKRLTIYFPDGLGRKRVHLYLATHEALHACFPDMQEKSIERASEDLTRFLWRLGFRKTQ